MEQSFKRGDSLPGLLVDGVEETFWVAGFLTFEEVQGIVLSIPFIRQEEQFATVYEWVRTNECPRNLLLLTDRGRFSLFGCRVGSTSVNIGGPGFSTVQIIPSEVVYKDRDGTFEDELKVTEVRSRLDGLVEWTSFGATTYAADRGEDNRVEQLNVTIRADDVIEWRHEDVQLTLSLDWRTDASEPGLRISEWVCLTTKFPDPRPFSEHLEYQRKVSSLLTLMFGTRASFRRHDVKDDRFTTKVMSGQVVDVPFVELVTDATASDYNKPQPKFKDPLAMATELQSEGLNRYLIKAEVWSRVIDPTAGTLRRSEAYVEDHIMNACVALEAAGRLIGPVEGEQETLRGTRPTTVTYIFRCLFKVGLEWSELADSTMDLARAVATNYNEVKHADRGASPEPVHTYVAGRVALLVARLLILQLIDPNQILVAKYGESRTFKQYQQNLRGLGVYVSSDRFEDRPATSTNDEWF